MSYGELLERAIALACPPLAIRLNRPYLELMKRLLTDVVYDPAAERLEGKDWPERAFTMIGLKRLENLQFCVERAIADRVPGDLIETGVWRGGSVIFMRAILKAHGVNDRSVWVADSFQGLPPPDLDSYPQDEGDTLHLRDILSVSLPDVQQNFCRFGLLDRQVRFLPGWFRDTLPSAPIDRLAVLRLDGDMYGSTMETLIHLYPKLSPGGYVIVDDYGAMATCKQAVEDFRLIHAITDAVQWIDWTGVFWRRTR